MVDDGLEWERLIDGLRRLGDAMRARVPERLRDYPQVMAESMRLLLSGLTRSIPDALVGDPRHPLFVPEINIAQNIFQPMATRSTRSAFPRVNPQQRAIALRNSRLAAQMRIIW